MSISQYIAKSSVYLTLIVITNSCSLFFGSSDYAKSKTYTASFKRSGWSKLSPDSSDMAFKKKSTNSIIIASSQCKKYDASSLKHLSLNMLSGIENQVIESKNYLNFSSREALRIYAKGKLDGVEVYLIIQTVRKNRCIYDFTLIAPSNDARETDKNDYIKFLNSITIE